MKVKDILTWAEILPDEEIKHTEWEMLHPRHKGIKVKSRLGSFKVHVEGKRYVDDEFISDWVQYLNDEEQAKNFGKERN